MPVLKIGKLIALVLIMSGCASDQVIMGKNMADPSAEVVQQASEIAQQASAVSSPWNIAIGIIYFGMILTAAYYLLSIKKTQPDN
tara:strand:- start:692 stop:946 length:255 start_codon:yes stop_codon:yes gene_type:complete